MRPELDAGQKRLPARRESGLGHGEGVSGLRLAPKALGVIGLLGVQVPDRNQIFDLVPDGAGALLELRDRPGAITREGVDRSNGPGVERLRTSPDPDVGLDHGIGGGMIGNKRRLVRNVQIRQCLRPPDHLFPESLGVAGLGQHTPELGTHGLPRVLHA